MNQTDWCAVHVGGLRGSASEKRGTHAMIDPVNVGEW